MPRRESSSADLIRRSFKDPTPLGTDLLTRAHPLVAIVLDMLDDALGTKRQSGAAGLLRDEDDETTRRPLCPGVDRTTG